MPDTTSTRFAAPLYDPDGSDEVDFPDQVNAVTAVFDAGAALLSEAFTSGDIKLSAAQTPPTGWLRCDGSAVSRTGATAALFAAVGVVYGPGNGSTTFNLPDYRGRTIVGSGAGVGLTSRVVGATGGEETHLLTREETGSQVSSTVNRATDFAPLAADTFVAHNNMQPFAVCSVFIKT